MMKKPKVNSAGVKKMLKSQKVQRDLQRRTDNIAAAAGRGMKASVEVGQNRARGSVFTVTAQAKRREAKERALTRAIDAGRR